MSSDTMSVDAITVQFTKGDVSILSHKQVLGAPMGETPPEERWLFSMQQIAAMNQLPTDNNPTELTASSEADRDTLAEKILDAVLLACAKRDELNEQVASVFSRALPNLNGDVVSESSELNEVASSNTP